MPGHCAQRKTEKKYVGWYLVEKFPYKRWLWVGTLMVVYWDEKLSSYGCGLGRYGCVLGRYGYGLGYTINKKIGIAPTARGLIH